MVDGVRLVRRLLDQRKSKRYDAIKRVCLVFLFLFAFFPSALLLAGSSDRRAFFLIFSKRFIV